MLPYPFLYFAVMAVAILSSAFSLPAQGASECPPATRSPTVILNPSPGRVTYSRQHDIKGLAALRQQNGHASTGRGAAVGLAQTQLGFRMETNVAVQSNGADGYCVYLTSVKATLGYDDINVYLASDYPVASCQYRVIREHEDRHVSIYRSNLAEFTQNLRARLVSDATSMGAYRTRNQSTAARDLQKQLHDRLAPILKNMETALHRNQRAIDTRASYASEQSRCPDW